MTIVTTMVKLFAAMLLGLVLGKKDIFDPTICKKLSRVIVNVTGPALVLCSVTSTDGTDPHRVMIAFAFGVVCYLLLPFLGYLFAKVLRVEKDLVGTYILTILLCNNSFMGFPVVQAMLGEEAIFFTSIIHFGFNIMFYALGLALIRRDACADSGEKFQLKSIFNAGTIAAILVMVIFFGHFTIPEVIVEPLSFVGSLTMPLSMMIIGANMAQYRMAEVFADKRMYALAIMRLVIVPLMVYVACMALSMDSYLTKVATITFGMPVAALVAMGTSPYEKQGKVGAVSVAFTTIFSLVTIPLWAIFLGI
ncbi:MAG: AEC family transporter [Lachnospiraceae bacterium]|nr:AEC family transporter [Lachnospiraceae bacterium]